MVSSFWVQLMMDLPTTDLPTTDLPMDLRKELPVGKEPV
jgi:hypothetical protein